MMALDEDDLTDALLWAEFGALTTEREARGLDDAREERWEALRDGLHVRELTPEQIKAQRVRVEHVGDELDDLLRRVERKLDDPGT